MKKRTYKQMQNKLYREIKRRMIAEQAMKIPVPVHIDHRNFDTLAIRSLVDKRADPANSAEYTEYIKRDMAHQLADNMSFELHEDYIECPYRIFVKEFQKDFWKPDIRYQKCVSPNKCFNRECPANKPYIKN